MDDTQQEIIGQYHDGKDAAAYNQEEPTDCILTDTVEDIDEREVSE